MVYVLGQLSSLVMAAAISNKVLVALGGVVVVVAILLVFAMVLRSNGNAKKSAGGLGYDPTQGPLGQPRGPLSQPMANRYATGMPQPQQQWGNEPDYGQAPMGAQGGYGAPANWGGQGYNDSPSGGYGEMPSGGYNDMLGAPGMQTAGPSRWATNAPQRWNPDGTPAGQPGMGGPMNTGMPAQNWDAPAAGGWQDQGGMGGQPAWGAQAAQPAQPSWNPPTPAWGAQAAPQQQQPSWQDQGWQGQAGAGMAGGMPGGMPAQNAGQNPGMGMPVGAAPASAQWGAPPAATPGYGDPMGQQARNPYATANRTATLVVRQGKEVGRTYDVRRDRTTIGRSRDSDIFLEDLAVSRLHTTINRDPNGGYVLRDENSANGTFVNNQRVSEHPLQEGDEVQVGQTVLTFQQR